MTGTLTLHGLKGTADIDYGTTLPTSPTTGQIFFQISDPWYELPPVNSSDNGKILTVVGGQWAAAAKQTELPSVSSSDNGKVLSVVNGAWASSNSLTTLSNNLGNLSNLTTTTKSSAVAAINEVKAGVDTNSDAIASLGTVLTGAWTATSSAATLVQLTQAITLTKGTWLVVITVPYADSGTPVVTFGPQSPYMDNQQFGAAQANADQAFRILTVETTQQVYAISGGSAAVNYNSSFLVRGGIKAVKIGM